MRFLSIILFATLFFAFNAMSQTSNALSQAVEVTVTPQQIYVEKGKSEQSLSFDFLLYNTTATALLINKIQLSVFDANDKLVLRKFANNGITPNLKDVTQIEGKKTLLLLNPFYSFDSALELKKLRYEFFLSDPKAEEKRYKSEVIVTPVYYQPKTDLILPLTGRALIYSGHDYYAHHRRVDTTNPIVTKLGVKSNPTRYGYDFCAVNENGDLYRGQGKNNEDWYGWGAPVYAPGGGIVKEMTNDVADNILGKKMFDFSLVFQNIKAFYGNYVVIDHLNGEYSLIAHLKQESIKVKTGEKIKQGQLIGQMGISGDADYVHIHYQLQNGFDLNAEALPSYFRNFRRILGSTSSKVEKGQMSSGDIVENYAIR